jgi:hypothetical protein
VAVTQRFFSRTSRQARLYYVIDAGLAAGLLTITVTGLAISTWFDLTLAGYDAWRTLHILASVTTLALVVVKIGVHWRWIAGTARKLALRTRTPRLTPALQPAPVPVAAKAVGRRDFLKLMVGVGALTTLAGTHVLGSLADGNVEAASAARTATDATAVQAAPVATPATSERSSRARRGDLRTRSRGSAQTATYPQTDTPSSSAGASSSQTPSSGSSTCTVRCNRACRFPGHCGRYTDANGNGRCDLGECLA